MSVLGKCVWLITKRIKRKLKILNFTENNDQTENMFFLNVLDSWNRAKIQAQKNEWVEVFFVDHGDCHWIENYNLLPISDRLIAKLPFQVRFSPF